MQLSHNHVFFTSANDIKSIIEPLSAYHISYFAYQRSYPDGSRLMFTSHIDDFQAYLTNKHYLEGNCEAVPTLYKKQAVLWSTLAKQHLYQFSRENFNIDHGLTLIEPDENYCEFYAFASSSEHHEVANFYLNNMDIIKRFTGYFKEKASSIIKEGENHKIVYPYHHDKIETFTMNDLQVLFNTLKVSPRQVECINLLLAGATTKEMAKQLKLSTRTIEYYINLLKIKFDVQTRSDLIIKLLTNKNMQH